MTDTNKETDPILIDVPMPIETPRLTLRPAMPNDGRALYDAIEETKDDLRLWMPWINDHTDVNHTEGVCRKAYADFILRKDMMMLAFNRAGNLVGATGLHRFDWKTRRFEIGYWVRKTEQGKGYATEIANALTRYAFNALSGNVVMIGHAEGNDASRNVIAKLGFDYEGCTRLDEKLPNGDIVDSHSYSRTNLDGLPDLKVTW